MCVDTHSFVRFCRYVYKHVYRSTHINVSNKTSSPSNEYLHINPYSLFAIFNCLPLFLLLLLISTPPNSTLIHSVGVSSQTINDFSHGYKQIRLITSPATYPSCLGSSCPTQDLETTNPVSHHPLPLTSSKAPGVSSLILPSGVMQTPI